MSFHEQNSMSFSALNPFPAEQKSGWSGKKKAGVAVGSISVLAAVFFAGIEVGYNNARQDVLGAVSDTSAPTFEGNDGGNGGSGASSSSQGEAPAVEIVDSGFGQEGNYVQGMVVVTNTGEGSVGEFVTASVNYLGAEGEIISTEEQVESFKWVGQELALPISFLASQSDVTVASMEPSVSLSDYGGESGRAPLPVLAATEIAPGQYGGYTASFDFTNETGEDLENLRVGVVCRDEAGEINGGTSTYPNLAPAGGTIRIDTDVTVSEQPASCDAYLNYWGLRPAEEQDADKARKDVPPLIKALEDAKAAASKDYAAARDAVEKAREAYREASARHAAIKSYVHGLVGGDELPRDQDGNITGVTAYVNPVTGGVYFEGERIPAPQPFKA